MEEMYQQFVEGDETWKSVPSVSFCCSQLVSYTICNTDK